MAQDETFQQAAEEYAKTTEAPPVDAVAKHRAELAQNLFGQIGNAAQAKADLSRAAQEGSTFRAATSWRQAEATAQSALAALIEFEAGLL